MAKKKKGDGVGYGKPPKHSRFKKGKSGNPQGRPKGALNIETVLEKTLRERVTVNENGRRSQITKLEAAFKQLSNKAASGDLAAVKMLLFLKSSAEERSVETGEPQTATSDMDQKLVQNMLKRFQVDRKEGDKE